jgi:endonuclease/exonuclease/phosphatase family metal-dependent hydrolase
MDFRVISYNIHRCIGMDRRFKPERVAEIIAHHNADLVFLQEVDVGVPRSRGLDLAEDLAARLGYPHVALGLNVQLRTGMYGNATLSRFPIRRDCNIDLTIDDRKARGCLYAEVELPGIGLGPVKMATFNMHLGLSFRERPSQVGRLVHSPEFQALTMDSPCLVAGDFNDWWTRLAPIFTEVLDFGCATNHGNRYYDAISTYPSFSPANGLDKIFFRGPLAPIHSRTCRLGISRVASDHLPIISDFRLVGKTSE